MWRLAKNKINVNEKHIHFLLVDILLLDISLLNRGIEMKVRVKNVMRGVSKLAGAGTIREVMINEDLMYPERESVSVCFRGRFSSGIVDFTVEEIEQSSEALVIPAFHLTNDMAKAIEKIRGKCLNGCNNYYLSLDIDILNECYDCTTVAENNLGLTKEQLSALLNGLHGISIFAADVTGFIPDFDVTGRTSTAIVENIIREVIGILRDRETRCC